MGIRGKAEKREETVAVAVNKDKGSQNAIKWAIDNLRGRGQALTLLHVKHTTLGVPNQSGGLVSISDVKEDVAEVYKKQLDAQAKELFLPFRCFCTKKAINCNEVVVEDTDITKGIINYVNANGIEILVLGAPSKSSFIRFMTTDVPTTVAKRAPDFCTVYVIGKGKISYVRSASSTLPPKTRDQLHRQASNVSDSSETQSTLSQKSRGCERKQYSPRTQKNDNEIMSPFSRGRTSMNKTHELSLESDITFVGSNGRSSTDNRSSISSYSGTKFIDMGSAHNDLSLFPIDSGESWSSANMDVVESEMRRLMLELKQTRDMYNTECNEARISQHKEDEVNYWKRAEDVSLEEAKVAEEAAMAAAEKEKAKCIAAVEITQAAQRVAEFEVLNRKSAEIKGLKEAEDRKKVQEGMAFDVRYRKYSLEEIEAATHDFSGSLKIGEGGYGPVYKGELDHTSVAIKVLRPDAAQGQSQFKREVEVLSCIRHPNMVLLLGACPEYGCLVYEYMANGSLEDRLFRKGNTPVIPWQLRFRIAAEIATALLFIHQSKPEPLVHRDLKPGNILLDQNYVSKISDVGLARLVPASVADSVTQYYMTSTAGTFCYIDPEYQQTGMLGTKSDIYSFGVMLLQIITGRPPMGLAHHVESAIEEGTFSDVLDPAVKDWPVEEALSFSKLALQCAEMRRKDRPDLGKVVLPELNRLRALGEDSMNAMMFGGGVVFSPRKSHYPAGQDVMSDHDLRHSGSDSSRTQSSTSSIINGRRVFSDM
ncbi:LOW QUALITY PROTEIN: U-box domain-containing protein 35-like [Argentina anserina]|uniref:LOW QUALITY PROTEIN: U-box domain-containing protein 35-like n=1 Tax=Argentina anserina TaxID=57926 RepID=UPI00217664A0|nr:LOW QUALITY PROTEIN: U-box domain-containing protein 35-like [Potentilla anserina]